MSAHELAALARQCSVCVVHVGVIVLHLCTRGYTKLFVEIRNISVPAESRKSGNLVGSFVLASLHM